MQVHPHARPIVSKLPIPSPISDCFSKKDWEIDLSTNTNPYLSEFSTYPDIHQEHLKNLYLSRISPTDHVKPDNILFTVGSMEGIDILLRTFCEPYKDSICILHPAFSAYEHWGLIHGLTIKRIPLLGENFDTFSIEDVMQSHAKMIWLCNPNNPTGTLLRQEKIETLCQSFQGLVVVDEAYIEFSDHPSALNYFNKYKNLIVLRTFSKAWGLAGVRCGSLIAHEQIIQSLRYVQLPFGLSSPTQDQVRNCLSSPERAMASWKRIKMSRQNMVDELSTLNGVEKIFKSETNFFLVVLKENYKVIEKLRQNKIKVLDCSLSVPSSIRVSVGTEDQNRKFIEVMRKASAYI